MRTCNAEPSAKPKKQFLTEYSFRPELIAAMRAAFLKACQAPQVRERGHGMTELVAERILELADAGETIPERLCMGALHRLSHSRQRPAAAWSLPFGDRGRRRLSADRSELFAGAIVGFRCTHFARVIS